MNNDYAALSASCKLTIFNDLQNNSLFTTFKTLVEMLASLRSGQQVYDVQLLSEVWASFIQLLVEENSLLDWYAALASLVISDDNVYTRACESDMRTVALDSLARRDLLCLHRLALCDLFGIECDVQAVCQKNKLSFEPVLTMPLDLSAAHSNTEKTLSLFTDRSRSWGLALEGFAEYWKGGAGIFAATYGFVWTDGTLEPVKHPDSITLDNLIGYEAQRSVVYENTVRFARGGKANNILLYGERGTGKSATVKAIARAFAESGDSNKNRLRIVEVKKEDLGDFTRIVSELKDRNFRFIIFIDDLSFDQVDSTFMGLKALLEGGLECRPDNVILYATSNRRHLVKEKFADRNGLGSTDPEREVRAMDSMQEHLSLADRFGLTIIFSAPNQDEFLQLVFGMMRNRGLPIDDIERIKANALRWEKWFNGRSPRTARQFVDWVEGGEKNPWD